jgi:hypothetical protein
MLFVSFFLSRLRLSVKYSHFAGPWNHVGMAVVGGWVGYNYSMWEKDLLLAVNEKRVEKGLPAINREQASPFAHQLGSK